MANSANWATMVFTCLVIISALFDQQSKAGCEEQESSASPRRIAVARLASAAGSLAVRPAAGTSYRPLEADGELLSTDRFVAFPSARLVSKDGKVTVDFPADLDGRTPWPVFDTAGTLHASEDVSLDLTLETGRVLVRNSAGVGAVVLRLRFWKQNWTIALENPEAQVLFDVTSRWPAGTRFRPRQEGDKSERASPLASAVLLVVKGNVSVDVGGVAVALSAPPGPAELRWDSLQGPPRQPRKLEQLPAWAELARPLSKQGQDLAAALDRLRTAFVHNPERALTQFAQSDNNAERSAAWLMALAFDNLELLERHLQAPRSRAEWDLLVALLRHWLARHPHHDQDLYLILTQRIHYSDAEARIVVQLLLGFSEEDLRLPETYQVLLDYLGHERSTIRNLAAWHLVRLVPATQRFPYKPDGTQQDALRTQQQWRQLLPPDSLPSSPNDK
ncbi:MAG: hypothetical protein NZU63_05355 [Gemmataceae bacterium]|nr:hypothetical protein [Gemmataceae bacterium]MDW8243405.1 hypothetical protein [Thermogemmata sp.]